MNIIPAGHRILVKPEAFEEVDSVYKSAKAAGFVLPESEGRKEQNAVDRGVVLAIGKTAFQDFGGEAWCQVGDTVVYSKYGGKFIDNYLVLNDEDVVAILKKEENE